MVGGFLQELMFCIHIRRGGHVAPYQAIESAVVHEDMISVALSHGLYKTKDGSPSAFPRTEVKYGLGAKLWSS